MKHKLRKATYLMLCVSLLFSIFACSQNTSNYQYLLISHNGLIVNQAEEVIMQLGENVDYNIGFSFCCDGKRILYVTRTYNSEGDYTDYSVCQYDPETGETKKISILEYLYCSAYPDIIFAEQQKTLRPSAIYMDDEKIYVLAKVNQDNCAVFVINCTNGEIHHSKPDGYSGQYISVSDDGRFVYLSKTENSIDYIIRYDILTDTPTVYMENAKGLTFSPDHQFMMYLTTERRNKKVGNSGVKNEYSGKIVVNKVASGEVVYECENKTACVYSFSGDSISLIKHETFIRHLFVSFENKEKWTRIDLLSNRMHALYETDWGERSVILLGSG